MITHWQTPIPVQVNKMVMQDVEDVRKSAQLRQSKHELLERTFTNRVGYHILCDLSMINEMMQRPIFTYSIYLNGVISNYDITSSIQLIDALHELL